MTSVIDKDCEPKILKIDDLKFVVVDNFLNGPDVTTAATTDSSISATRASSFIKAESEATLQTSLPGNPYWYQMI